MPDANAAIVRQWFEQMWNGRDEALLEKLMAPDCRGETEGGTIVGRKDWIANVYVPFTGAFPDLRIDVIGTVAERDEVMVRWHASGTHLGDHLGMPASGVAVSFHGMTWMRLRDGRIVEGEDRWNQTGLQQALQTRSSWGTVAVVARTEEDAAMT